MRKRGLVGQDASEEFDCVVLYTVACIFACGVLLFLSNCSFLISCSFKYWRLHSSRLPMVASSLLWFLMPVSYSQAQSTPLRGLVFWCRMQSFGLATNPD